ncbi:MAG TPA: hypothetical protein VNE17_10260 [Nitrolancea sp.]|nr:hypothetical protein [Nitrolancea sp.]
MDVERLRWAIFTSSVISTVGNPEAHLWRRIGALLRQQKHDATFFEERGNPALRALLQQSGGTALLQFRERFPDIQYRTLDPRTGYDLADWLTRTLSTVDIAVAQRGAPDELLAILSAFSRPYLQTFVVDCGWDRPLPEPTVDPSQFAGLTGVLVANESLAEAYRQTIPAARIQLLGPLPERLTEDEMHHDAPGVLDDAARQIVTTITSIAERIRQARGAQILPNGRTDEADHPITHEAD